MYTIGIDIGTTSICGVLINSETGKIEEISTVANTSFIQTENTWEKLQDASVIKKEVFNIIDSLFQSECLNGEKIGAIGISGQMHGIIYTDKNGNAVSPLYIWQDERGNQIYKDNKSYAQYLGSSAGYGLVTDFYNRENGLVPIEAAHCCTIGDYIGMQLCSNFSPIMHISNAASFGLFDISTNKFLSDNGILPEITDEFHIIGEFKGAKVISAIGDNQASFMGSVNGNMPLVNVGTGSQISYLSESAVTGENIETRPYDGKRFLVVGSSLCGGRAFSLLERFFASAVEMATGEKCNSLYKQIDNLLLTKTQTDMKADSRFCGTRANPNIRASFYNVSQENFTAGDMAVAMLYAIADELHTMYTGSESKNIVCSGNGIRKNPALQRVVSEVFGANVKIPYYTEEAAYGAALAATTAIGEFCNLKEAQKIIKYR